MAFLLIQNLYILYIYDTKPHTSKIFNRLEFYNEGSLILLAYIMIGYSEVMPSNNDGNLLTFVMSLVITVGIAFANLFVLAKLTYNKIMLKFKQKKAT